MNLLVAKVFRNGLCRDVDYLRIERIRGETEPAQIRGKEQFSSRAKQVQTIRNQLRMIALHVEHGLHFLRIGKGRRIENDQIKPLPCLNGVAQECQHIRTHQMMTA